MFSALISFLGGSAFRMIWGEISAHWTAKKEHQYEIERMKLQNDLDEANHKRSIESQKLQAELGVKVIQAESDAAVDVVEANAWYEAVASTGKKVGVAWVDAWNAIIRPAGATWALLVLTANEMQWLAQPLSEGTASVCFAFLGLFVADRALGKKGK